MPFGYLKCIWLLSLHGTGSSKLNVKVTVWFAEILFRIWWPVFRFPLLPADPFFQPSISMLDSMFDDVKRMDKRQFLYQVLSFGMIVSSALMIWKGLMVCTGSESPIVVVLSGSMEPAFHRGDLLFLTNYEAEDIRVGEIVVFKVRWDRSRKWKKEYSETSLF